MTGDQFWDLLGFGHGVASGVSLAIGLAGWSDRLSLSESDAWRRGVHLNVLILAAIAVTGLLLWSPKLIGSTTWRAMTTPLASIIGSGFLVLGPVLIAAYGQYAPLLMAVLCIGSYCFGSAIRYNMSVIERRDQPPNRSVERLEITASWSLGFAYIISVAYYLNLFGAFGVSLTPFSDPFYGRLLTSALFVVILGVGWTRGFKMLERLEYVSVSLKLAIIAGLLIALAVYFQEKAANGQLIFNAPEQTGWSGIALAFGLIITVQGFETSRYLGDEYDSQTRVRSMRQAQWLSSAIYMTYILLVAYVFERSELKLTETAIVDMMGIISPILPALLVAAGLAAQFSAAVADTSGSGGLMSELTGHRITPRMAYLVLTVIGLALTWSANVFEIISYASRAFAAYYALQSAIAALRSWNSPQQRWRSWLYATLAVLGIMIVFFGVAVET